MHSVRSVLWDAESGACRTQSCASALARTPPRVDLVERAVLALLRSWPVVAGRGATFFVGDLARRLFAAVFGLDGDALSDAGGDLRVRLERLERVEPFVADFFLLPLADDSAVLARRPMVPSTACAHNRGLNAAQRHPSAHALPTALGCAGAAQPPLAGWPCSRSAAGETKLATLGSRYEVLDWRL